MTAMVRFDLTMDAAEKDVLSRAAALMGTTMAAFVRSAAKEKAKELLGRVINQSPALHMTLALKPAKPWTPPSKLHPENCAPSCHSASQWLDIASGVQRSSPLSGALCTNAGRIRVAACSCCAMG